MDQKISGPGMEAYVCNLSTWKTQEERLQVKSSTWARFCFLKQQKERKIGLERWFSRVVKVLDVKV